MEIKNQPKLRFMGVDIINVNFISSTLKKESKIDIKVEPQVFLPADHPDIFKIIMKVILTGEENFHLDLVAVGNFEVSSVEEVTSEIRNNLINANATAIMFPYIRAFISTFTANLGDTTGAITIPTKFFKGEIKEFTPTSDNAFLSSTRNFIDQ